MADGQGIPLGVTIPSASPAEVTLAEETLSTVRLGKRKPGRPRTKPERLIVDRACDRDPFRDRLARRHLEQITPHRRNRTKPYRLV